MASLGQWPTHLIHAILAWFRDTDDLASTTLEWKGSRALIDPFPPPPIKKFPAPDMAMSANKITTTMNWAVAPSAIPGNKIGTVWSLYGDEISSIGRYNKSINQYFFSFLLPSVVFTLFAFALLLYCSGFARRIVGCVVGRVICKHPHANL